MKGLRVLLVTVVCSACSTIAVEQVDTADEAPAALAKPMQQQVPGPQPLQPVAAFGKSVNTVTVASRKRLTNAVYRRVGPDVQLTIPPSENVIAGRSTTRGRGKPVEIRTEKADQQPSIEAWVNNSSAFLSTDFDDNVTLNSSVFIPPDSHAAAGPLHVVNVVNTIISFHQKDGTLDHRNSLSGFFSGLSPSTATFDPKVVYDQYRQRWLVVTLEQTEGPPLANDTSKIFLAVSDDANPNGTWTVTSFDSKLTLGGATHWADYPGFAVGEDAVYIAVNMFRFSSGTFGGVRLWIVDKGVGSGGFYDGGAAVFSLEDPYAVSGIATTTQPAQIYGTIPGIAGTDTYLVSYSGLSGGGSEFIQIVRLDNPLSTPSFTRSIHSVGNIDNTAPGLPDAGQLGSTTDIEVNDRRALDAVWINDKLWMTATVLPPTGVNSGQATAYWFEVDTTSPSSLTVADQGMIGGEGIVTGASTFFPAVAVNGYGDVTIGFSASHDSIFAGSYFVTRETGDAAGTTGLAQTVVAGTDFYVRTFGGSRNRWGDYSATAVDPVDGCFWVYNQHAQSRGTPTSGGEDGRWATAYAKSCNLTHACSESVSIPAGQWTNFAMPCNTSPDNQVSDVFSGLVEGDYGVTWIVYRRVSSTPASNVALTITDSLTEGEGYWVFTTNATTVNLSGTINTLADIDLFGVALGRQNYVGHNQDTQISWADVLFINGGDVLTLTEADTAGSISRIMNKWNGAAYQVFNGNSPMTGTLDAFDGVWVKAYDTGIKLRIPQASAVSVTASASAEIAPVNMPSQSKVGPADDLDNKKNTRRPWHIQLTATSGDMQDPGNFFGRLEGSSESKDINDLEELAPFGSRYLTVLFINPVLKGAQWGYTSDFRKVKKKPGGIWPFVVKASSDVAEVTLSWEGHDFVFEDAWLTDEESGETFKAHSSESYTFDMTGGEHHFTFEIGD